MLPPMYKLGKSTTDTVGHLLGYLFLRMEKPFCFGSISSLAVMEHVFPSFETLVHSYRQHSVLQKSLVLAYTNSEGILDL